MDEMDNIYSDGFHQGFDTESELKALEVDLVNYMPKDMLVSRKSKEQKKSTSSSIKNSDHSDVDLLLALLRSKSMPSELRESLSEQALFLKYFGADDESSIVRKNLALNGYHLDTLVEDKDYKVRQAVASHACKSDREDLITKLLKDENTMVLSVIAEQGKHLDELSLHFCSSVRSSCAVGANINKRYDILNELILDEVPDVRKSVSEIGFGLDLLVDDDNDRVRASVAIQGYNLIELVNDPSPRVRLGVSKFIAKEYWDKNPEGFIKKSVKILLSENLEDKNILNCLVPMVARHKDAVSAQILYDLATEGRDYTRHLVAKSLINTTHPNNIVIAKRLSADSESEIRKTILTKCLESENWRLVKPFVFDSNQYIRADVINAMTVYTDKNEERLLQDTEVLLMFWEWSGKMLNDRLFYVSNGASELRKRLSSIKRKTEIKLAKSRFAKSKSLAPAGKQLIDERG